MVICRRLYYSERQLPKEVFADRICQLVHQSNSQLWLWWSNVAVVIPSPVSILKCISVAHASYILCGNVYALTWHYQQTLLHLHQSDYSLHSSELFQKMHLLISANRNKKINTLLGTNKQRMSIRRTKVIMPVITRENGFIFKCYFMTQSIFQTTLIPCCMDIILSTRKLFVRWISEKRNLWQCEWQSTDSCARLTHCSDRLSAEAKKNASSKEWVQMIVVDYNENPESKCLKSK